MSIAPTSPRASVRTAPAVMRSPAPRRRSLPRPRGPREAALTATLLCMYVGLRGTARALGALEGLTFGGTYPDRTP
jgi:hypothetical protein